jgi:hypothetical protein
MLIIRRDAAYGLVTVWGAIGVSTKPSSVAIIYYAAIGTAVIILLAILLLPLITRKGFAKFYLRSEE